MAKYKAPGAYAHFIPTESTVGSSGQLRVLALIGTGQKSFDKQNVLITRGSDSIYDQLLNDNILEVYSISSKPITNKIDSSNRIYSHYKLKNDTIVWESLPGAQYRATLNINTGSGNPSFKNNVTVNIEDEELLINETYRLEIFYVEKQEIGTYIVKRESTNEVIGEYVASAGKVHTDIIPGLSIKVTSTFIADNQDPTESKTKIGDYILIKTTAPKCHIIPQINVVPNNTSNENTFIIKNGGSAYNIVGDGKNVISTVENWPKLTNNYSLTKDYVNTKFQFSILQNNNLVNADSIFSKLSVTINGIVKGSNITKTISLFDSQKTTGPESIAQNTYDITSALSDDAKLVNADNFSITYNYILKDDMTLDQSNIILHMEISSNAPSVKLATLDNMIYIRNNIISHNVISSDEIFSKLITNLNVLNPANVVAANYKIKINSIAKNEITIFDITNNVKIGTYSTDTNAEFNEAIPGISFTLYPFNEIEGLIEMYNTKDISDTSGSTLIISTLPGILNPEIPEDNSSYYISYKYAKDPSGYEPQIFTDYSDIVSEYGKYIVTASGNVINSLSLGAEIAFQNGACPIICVQAKNETDQEIITAIDKLTKKIGVVDNINAIAPLTTSKTVAAYLERHVELYSSSEHNMYRIGYFGAELNELIDKEPTISNKSQGSIQVAKKLNNERMVYVIPGKVSKKITDVVTGYTSLKVLPGCYLATAVAALSMKNDPAEPLTNKQIFGFDNLLVTYTEPEMNMLAAAGCLVVKQEGSQIKVRHGITTHGCIDTLSDIQANEITLVQIKDYVIDGCRKVLGNLYVGGKLKPTIIHDVEYTLKNTLNKYISDEIIISIEGLSVKRNAQDPRQIDVKFLIEAVYPLNFIDISFGFSTTIS